MDKWVICSGPDWYRPSVGSTKQIIKQFYKDGYKILYINSLPFKPASVNSVSRKSLLKKVLNKLVTHLKIFRKIDRSFYVFVPLFIPAFTEKAEKWNKKIFSLQLDLLRSILRIKTEESLLISAGAFVLLPEFKKKYRRKIYQAGDFISDFRNTTPALKEKLLQKEKELCDNSHVIFASSTRIKEKLSALTENKVDLLYHGVDFKHFTTQTVPAKEIEKIKCLGLPVAGYFGSLSDANDLGVFSEMAKNGFSVVIIGKVLGDYSILENMKNIYILGPVDYEKLPSYGQSFDVCLMNWHMSDWIKNSFPIKTLEYLAMGKPVVSVPIPVVNELFSGLVYFAGTPEEFVKQSKLALKENSFQKERKRIDTVRKYDWANRYEIIISRIFDKQI